MGVLADVGRLFASGEISGVRVLKPPWICPRKSSEKLSFSVALAALRLVSEPVPEVERFNALLETGVPMILPLFACVSCY